MPRNSGCRWPPWPPCRPLLPALAMCPVPARRTGPPSSNDEDAALEGAMGSPTPPSRGREAASLPTGNGRFEDAGSYDDLKPKWEEEELEDPGATGISGLHSRLT